MPRLAVPDDVNGLFSDSPQLRHLQALGSLELHRAPLRDADDLVARCIGAEIVLSFRPAFTKFPAAVLERLPGLRYLLITGAGVEDVDLKAAERLGVAVGNIVEHDKRSMSEHCLALLFAVARRLPAQDRDIRQGLWAGFQGRELRGKRLGIVGLSAIGQEVAVLGAALGMEVVSWSRDNAPERAAAYGSRALPLDEVLATADVLSLHLRLFPELRGFLNAERIGRMKPGAILINTARGELVDEVALAAALKSGRLGGAGIDVWAKRPLPPDHPFLTLDNVVMTPITAWNTVDAAERLVTLAIDSVRAFIAGKPINIRNEPAGRVPAQSEG